MPKPLALPQNNLLFSNAALLALAILVVIIVTHVFALNRLIFSF